MKAHRHVLILPGNQVEAIVIVEPDESLRVLVLMEKDREEDRDTIDEWLAVDVDEWLDADVLPHYGHRDNVTVTSYLRLHGAND